MEYGFEYDFSLPPIAEDMAIGVAGVAVAFALILVLLMLALSIVSYVLGSTGMYRIAKRRGIHHAWLAWVPVGNSWLLGSISDHFQYVVKKKNTGRRKVLLILQLATVVLSGGYGAAIAAATIAEGDAGSIGAVALSVIIYLIMLGAAIATMVFAYISYYDLFSSCRPGSAVLFLVLGIFFGFTLPFFVFACSGTDMGMPAKREPQKPAQIPATPEPVIPHEPEQIPVVEAELVDEPEDM